MPKTSQKRSNFKKTNFIVFLARNYFKKLIQWAETAKNGFKCFKMHSNTYSPKRATKCQKMVNNGKKCQKITNNCKISEITKYCEKLQKLTKMSNNVNKCKKMGLKRHRFSGSKRPTKKWYQPFSHDVWFQRYTFSVIFG